MFIVACCFPDEQGRDWIRIGRHDFDSDEAAWDPPKYIQDVINPEEYRISHKGVMRDAKQAETQGLEECVLWFPEHIKKRILKEVCPTK